MTLKSILQEIILSHRVRRALKRNARIARQVEEELQIREARGTLYISHHGTPLIPRHLLKDGDILTALAQIRAALTEYYKTRIS